MHFSEKLFKRLNVIKLKKINIKSKAAAGLIIFRENIIYLLDLKEEYED